ncbi:MAG: sigma 54-interacting transcriptional regulator [Deltaproteobacteria bacterium]|nr:sigma 54-interacting transcriptional regulator [Deltaproteobacteria bacterium]
MSDAIPSALDLAEEAIFRGERARAQAALAELHDLSGGDAARAAALGAALRTLADGDPVGALELIEPALAEQRLPRRAAATVNLFAAWILSSEDPRAHRGHEALSRGQRALRSLEEESDRPLQILCLLALGQAYLAEGEPALAMEMWARSQGVDPAPSVWHAMAQGWLAGLEGRPVGSVDALRRAAELADGMDLPFLRAKILASLAERLEDAGERYETSIAAARRAVDALRAVGPHAFHTTSRAFRVLGDLLMRAGRWDEARDVLGDALRQAEASGDQAASALRESLGALALRRGDVDDARLQATRAAAHGSSDPRAGIPADRLAARIAAFSGDAASALALFTRVRDSAGSGGPAIAIEAELGRAAAAIVAGDLDMATRAVDAAAALLEPFFRPRLQTEFDHVRGKFLAALGRHEEAVVSLERARVAHEAAGDRYEAACVELDIAAHAATTGCGADVERIEASADVLTAFGSPLGPRLRSLARTLAARPGGGTTASAVALPLELLATPGASTERILRTIFQTVSGRLAGATVAVAEKAPGGTRRSMDRRGEAAQDVLDDYELRDRMGRRFILSIQREPGRESPWLGTLLASAELALEAAALRTVGHGVRATAPAPSESRATSVEGIVLGPRLPMLERVSSSRWPLLVAGETGTGKRRLARAIHGLGPPGPIVEVDCGALEDATLEADLSGHRKAGAGRRGLVREAEGGTLLLLDVEELTPRAQEYLRRFLATGEVVPVGSRTALPVAARVLATTRSDLEALADEGRFDRSLYHWLTSLPVRLDPLRERPEAVVSLARLRLGELTLTRDALMALLAHSWPQNLPELFAVLDAAAGQARAAGRPTVELADLAALVRRRRSRAPRKSTPPESHRQ